MGWRTTAYGPRRTSPRRQQREAEGAAEGKERHDADGEAEKLDAKPYHNTPMRNARQTGRNSTPPNVPPKQKASRRAVGSPCGQGVG